jgi:hypothetical protein
MDVLATVDINRRVFLVDATPEQTGRLTYEAMTLG